MSSIDILAVDILAMDSMDSPQCECSIAGCTTGMAGAFIAQPVPVTAVFINRTINKGRRDNRRLRLVTTLVDSR